MRRLTPHLLTGLTALLLAVWVASGRWAATYAWVDARRQGRVIGVCGGGVLVYAVPSPAWWTPVARGFSIKRVGEPEAPYTLSWRGIWLRQGSAYNILVPLWPPLVLLIGGTALAWRRRGRRRAGSCSTCGYDLRGLTAADENGTPTCPECGT